MIARACVVAALLALAGCDWSVEAFDRGGGSTGDVPCADELRAFQESVYAPVLAVRCIGCHNASGTARQTRFVLTSETSETAHVANFRATRRVAQEKLAGTPLLLLRPTGRHPDGHTGGALFTTESATYRTLEDFVAMVSSEACESSLALTCDAITPGSPRLRRLSHREYENTVRDLFGIRISTTTFVRDAHSNGFDDDGETLAVAGTLGEQYLSMAETIAKELMRTPTRVHACATSTTPTAACVETVVRELGARAFRRPMSSDDVTRYTGLHARLVAIDATSAFERVLVAMLISPHFLYRSELGRVDGSVSTLDAYEVATELSYAITGTMPDATLRAKAADGSLLEDATLDAEGRRLLATSEARETFVRFVSMWLSLDRLANVPKDDATYPEMDDALRASMQRETTAFVSHVIGSERATFHELMTADYSFTDARLRAHYGVSTSESPDADGLARTSFASTQRRGLLTHAGVLSVHARPNDSSPVHRGRLVREHLLCQTLPPPPPGIVAMPPPLDPSLSTRERYRAHSSVEPCASCHRMMDPIGFGFEAFDGIGRTRAGSIDTHGEIVEAGSATGAFDDVAGLLATLAESDEALDCFARQWFRFAYGLVETRALECLLQDVQADFRASGGHIEELVVALVLAPHVRTRSSGGANPPTTTMDAGIEPGDDAGVMTMDASVPPPVEITVTVGDRWEAGYCATVRVRNTSSASVTWSAPVRLDVGFHLSSHWSATQTGTSGDVITFAGVAWNATLPAGGETTFGLCADR